MPQQPQLTLDQNISIIHNLIYVQQNPNQNEQIQDELNNALLQLKDRVDNLDFLVDAGRALPNIPDLAIAFSNNNDDTQQLTQLKNELLNGLRQLGRNQLATNEATRAIDNIIAIFHDKKATNQQRFAVNAARRRP